MDLSAPSATTDVLTTSELLENVLYHLPPASLLRAQSTCRLFHTLISTSPLLQSCLFFRAPPPSSSKSSTKAASFTPNHLLLATFPGFFSSSSRIPKDDWDLLFGHLDRSLLDVGVTATMEKFKRLPFNDPAKREAMRRKEASWRRMHIAKPPIKRIEFVNTHHGQMQTTVEHCVIELGMDSEETDGEKRAHFVVARFPEGRSSKREAPSDTWGVFEDGIIDLENFGKLPASEAKEVSSAPPVSVVLKDEGLRMGVLYDYIEEVVCGSNYDRPSFQLSFEVHGGELEMCEKELGGSGDEAGSEEIVDESDIEFTLRVALSCVFGCVIEEEPPMLDFHSEGFEKVQVVGTQVSNKASGMWDDDGGL
ncbi:uncharacterized protein BDZ99DRAFT_576170 [Mytilinidion resinicola]|uniref:F-box domain-containing protein n=1 Tax=Mytilinidion resinicola TaxID=574789 RepID=A0A6A6Y407_9PEZI|nr:uncharacterized protein BDZ99DRAFT_576170 [Mytilinidion resinicola]KAF2803253.1 hypothetical protein BDZ99DRAFT_576170 [Mytilinidion resinicola]